MRALLNLANNLLRLSRPISCSQIHYKPIPDSLKLSARKSGSVVAPSQQTAAPLFSTTSSSLQMVKGLPELFKNGSLDLLLFGHTPVRGFQRTRFTIILSHPPHFRPRGDLRLYLVRSDHDAQHTQGSELLAARRPNVEAPSDLFGRCRGKGPDPRFGLAYINPLFYFSQLFSFQLQWWGASSCCISLLASHQGDPGSIPGWVTPDFHLWESSRTMPLVGGFFLGDLPFPPPFHSSAAPYSPQSSLSALKTLTLRAVQNLSTPSQYERKPPFKGWGQPQASFPTVCARLSSYAAASVPMSKTTYVKRVTNKSHVQDIASFGHVTNNCGEYTLGGADYFSHHHIIYFLMADTVLTFIAFPAPPLSDSRSLSFSEHG
ncbi:hypothetical protein PR048_025337 [Dryococelus australis]|uniref:Uncharacterized protein n=1 Tax=Dryococelus australis TaxID=614101 RepID=A0ABQ9GR38_9NEOP|nr:hypothetical protein PR048_025337 [Dryococelus australis]